MFSNGRRDIDWKDRQRDPTWLRRTSLKYPRCLENLIITISSQERRDAGVPKKMERQGYRRAVICTTMWRLNQDHIATRWIFLMQLHLPCISIRLCGHSSPANCFSIDCFPRRWSSILGKSLRKRFGLQFMGANHMRSKYQEFSKTIERYEWRQSFFWFLKLSRAHSSGPCFFLPNIQQANLSPASCSQADCSFPRRMKVPHGVLVTIWIIPNRSQSILFRLGKRCPFTLQRTPPGSEGATNLFNYEFRKFWNRSSFHNLHGFTGIHKQMVNKPFCGVFCLSMTQIKSWGINRKTGNSSSWGFVRLTKQSLASDINHGR